MSRPSRGRIARSLIEGAVFGDLFTPIGLKPTVLFPGTNGGANWGGASFDPETHTLYVNSMDVGMHPADGERGRGIDVMPYRARGNGLRIRASGTASCIRARSRHGAILTAIDVNTGEFRWR